MSAVPPTPFLPSRLGDGYGEESLLMAQEPIFEDQSFADNTFWTSTPRPKSGSLQRSPSVDCPEVTIVQDRDNEEENVHHESNSTLALEMEDTEYSGRGERQTLRDEQASEASSSKSKRGMGSPGMESTRKRSRPRSPTHDDYYHRRLSRQGSSTSLLSPSLPTLYLPCSFSALSRPGEASSSSSFRSQLPTSRAPIASRSSLDIEMTHTTTDFTRDEAECNSPRPAPTRLSKFLAKSSVLHPPKRPSIIDPHIPQRSPDHFEIVETPQPQGCTSIDTPSLTRDHDSTSQHDSASSQSFRSASHNSLPATPSLRKSTSQKVLGFLSDLVRSASSSTIKIPVGGDNVGNQSTTSIGRDVVVDASNGDGRQDSVKIGQRISNSSADHVSIEEGESATEQDQEHSRTSSGSQISQRPLPRAAILRQPAGFVSLTKPNRAFISNTASRASNPIRRPTTIATTTGSSFTSAALARLPPSGKGSSSSGEKVTIKPNERASNLKARRALFERPSNAQSEPQPRPRSQPTTTMKRTIPLVGRTPGKASKARAQARQRFDQDVQQRVEGREQLHVGVERRKRDEGEREYAARRKETVIRAKPVPEMYK